MTLLVRVYSSFNTVHSEPHNYFWWALIIINGVFMDKSDFIDRLLVYKNLSFIKLEGELLRG